MNPEPTDLNDLAAIARTTKSARYRRALATAISEIENLRARVREPTDLNDLAAITRNLLDRYTVIVEKEEEREGLWLLHGRIEHGADSNSGDVQGEHQ